MKRFTSLVVAALIVLVTSATAQQSRVILNSNSNYEIQIDGRNFNGAGTSTITDLLPGVHTVSVYQVVSNGILGIGKKRNLLSTQQFNLGSNDVRIDVSQDGQLQISQNGYNSNNDRVQNTNGGYRDKTGSENGRYGKSEGKGKGNKYGHYKNKNKNKQHNKHDD